MTQTMKKNPFLLSTLISTMLLCHAASAAQIQHNSLSNATSDATLSNTVAQQPSQLWELRQMVDQLQREVRELRGQLEEKDNQLERLNQDFKNNYDDLDQRIELLNKKIDPDAQTDTEQEKNSESNAAQPASTNSTENNPPATAQNIAHVDTDQSDNNTIAVTANNSNLTDKEAYELAYKAYQQGGAAKAIQPMQDFIRQYPNSIYRSHAFYWLGEFNLAINPPDFNASKKYFKTVATQFPDSSKAPISLYRLGEISGNIEHNSAESNSYFQRLLQKYPNSAAASRAKTTYLR